MNQNSQAIRQHTNQQSQALHSPGFSIGKFNKDSVLLRHHRTHPLVWCSAIICLIFILLLIFFGVATLFIFLLIKPKYPVFDISNAKLGAIYFNSPEYFNGDFAMLANFSNPNKKLEVRFEYLDIELFFSKRLIATQHLQPFSLRPGEIKSGAVHMVSSLVYLPPKLAVELQQKVQSNKVEYNITGKFKVRAKITEENGGLVFHFISSNYKNPLVTYKPLNHQPVKSQESKRRSNSSSWVARDQWLFDGSNQLTSSEEKEQRTDQDQFRFLFISLKPSTWRHKSEAENMILDDESRKNCLDV